MLNISLVSLGISNGWSIFLSLMEPRDKQWMVNNSLQLSLELSKSGKTCQRKAKQRESEQSEGPRKAKQNKSMTSVSPPSPLRILA